MFSFCDHYADIPYENSLSRDSDVNLHLISSEISENLRREAKTAFVALAEARRLKKMVRFDGSRQSTKDSGIDMGSSICTSIEDSNSFFKVFLLTYRYKYLLLSTFAIFFPSFFL